MTEMKGPCCSKVVTTATSSASAAKSPSTLSSTYTLLGELLGLLVLRVTEELHHALLVGREAGNLADDRLDEGLLLAGGLVACERTVHIGDRGRMGVDG
jgi:hypothetical protein